MEVNPKGQLKGEKKNKKKLYSGWSNDNLYNMQLASLLRVDPVFVQKDPQNLNRGSANLRQLAIMQIHHVFCH